MNIPGILEFLKLLAANNNREWFQAHKADYLRVQADFEELLSAVIARISEFDKSVSHVQPQDCTYRIYRDTRFSADKSPYKNHWEGTSMHVVRNPTTAAITCIWNPVTACWQEEAGVCLLRC